MESGEKCLVALAPSVSDPTYPGPNMKEFGSRYALKVSQGRLGVESQRHPGCPDSERIFLRCGICGGFFVKLLAASSHGNARKNRRKTSQNFLLRFRSCQRNIIT